MDESDPGIVFTETGCNHCDNYFQVAKWIFRPYGELEQLARAREYLRKVQMQNLLSKIGLAEKVNHL